MNIQDLNPKSVWKNFYALTQIPRPSKREAKAVEYLVEFGQKLGLETIKDEVGNVIIRKPATVGMENRQGIILQAHIDMVPQKNNDKVHDWDNDPVEPRIIEDWVWATGTTLGADNGLGCAVAMAVLEDKELVHGPVEALFTIDEETGMTHVGFAGAILNPFTIGIAQDLAGLPLFSGIEYRLFCWIVLNVITISFVLLYANKVKRNPQKSIMYEADSHWRNHIAEQGDGVEYYRNSSSWISFAIAAVTVVLFTVAYSADTWLSIGAEKFHTPWLLPVLAVAFIASSIISLRKSVHFYILQLLGFTIIYLVVGVLGFSWYIGEISALFLSLGVLSGIAMGLSANSIVNELMAGAKDILSAALIVGLAAGIVYILQEGRIIDTLLHSMASTLGEAGEAGSLGLMYAIQTVINLVIPSASAKAAITMPIMAPFADIIGVSRQATVMAFQFGDGFTNMITPTSGVLIAVLGIARIPYGKWCKWALPFILGLIVVGFLLLLPTIYMQLNGF